MDIVTITPHPAPPGITPRTRYDWSKIVIGEWQRWLDLNPDVPQAESTVAAERVRLAARDYAGRHGLRVESRRLNHSHVLDLRFTERTEHE